MTAPRRGLSIVGLLVAVAMMAVLFAISMSALNRATTGEGSAVQGTVRSFQDEIVLTGLLQGVIVMAEDGRYPTPSRWSENPLDDDTAAFWSCMVMHGSVRTGQLIAANEYSPVVEAAESYDHNAWRPGDGVFWDRGFVADLDQGSNVSWAHMPFHGTRFDRRWRDDFRGAFPLLGNRGPKDGVEDPDSYSYGRSGVWGGHLAYADGRVEFVDTFTPGEVSYEAGGERRADNVFRVDDGIDGADAILAFTRRMTRSGPELQWD